MKISGSKSQNAVATILEALWTIFWQKLGSMASVTVLAANWLIGAGSVLVLGLLAVRTPKEERMLIEKFGQQYRDYMAKTGRFIPRF